MKDTTRDLQWILVLEDRVHTRMVDPRPQIILDSYLHRVIPADRASCAASLLLFWERAWSSNAKRYAYHALAKALSRGIDVLE